MSKRPAKPSADPKVAAFRALRESNKSFTPGPKSLPTKPPGCPPHPITLLDGLLRLLGRLETGERGLS